MPEPVIPYGRQSVDEEDVQAVAAALRGDFLTTGPLVVEFERALAAVTGARHAVAVNSGTAALHAAYAVAGVGPGDEVITSPLTFAATANAARYLGATLRFADIVPDTGLIDPTAIEAVASPRTRVVAPVDYAGAPADYGRIAPLAARRGWKVVADAAHSLGASLQGRSVGTLADLTAVSLHPVKPITTGEGGVVLTADAGLAAAAARFRSHGIERDPARLERNDGPWYHEQQELGFNYRLTDIQCALGLSQLRRLSAFIDRRNAIAARYQRDFAAIAGIELPVVAPGSRSGWHLYVVRVREAARRSPLFARLRELGLGVQVHYLPVYLHPYYRRLGYQPGLCPHAEDFYARCISLPVFPRMTDAEVARVVELVVRACREVL